MSGQTLNIEVGISVLITHMLNELIVAVIQAR